MPPPPAPFDLDDLARETLALRRLAVALVRDELEAEDLVQETFVAAATGAGRPRGGLGAWLRGVLRNRGRLRRRGAARRLARESLAARSEVVPATVDSAQRIEVQRRVLAAIEALDEPLRRTVLARYFDDLPPRGIAAREGVPVATVKSRLVRAKEALRVRLDDLHDGDRRAWALLLVPGPGLAGAAGSTAPLVLAGGLAVKKFGLAALALALFASAAWLAWPRPVDRVDERSLAASASPAGTPAGPPSPAALVGSGGMPARPPARVEATTPETVEIAWVGCVLDDRRRPVAGAVVRLHDQGEILLEARTDDLGRWRLAGTVASRSGTDAWTGVPLGRTAARSAVLEARDQGGRVARRGASLSAGPLGTRELEWAPLVLEAAHGLEVRVEAEGRPVAGADVLVGNAEPGESAPRWLWPGRVRADAEGRARLQGLVAGWVAVVAYAEGRSPAVVTAPVPGPTGQEGGELVVSLPPLREVLVQVVEDGSGLPVPGAHVIASGSLPLPGRGPFFWAPPGGFAPTGADGWARVPVFETPPRMFLRARASGRPSPQRPDAVEVFAQTTQVVLKVPAPSALVFPLEEGEGDLPADGTTVRIVDADILIPYDACDTPDTGTIEGARLVIPDATPQSEHAEQALLAVLPDDRLGLLVVPQGASQGAPVHFVRPRTLGVRVLDADGRPATGVGVTVGTSSRFLPGAATNRPPGAVARNLHPGIRPVEADGTVFFHPMWPEEVHVRVYGLEVHADVEESIADLTEGDAELTFQLPPRRVLEVRVLVNGEARLPPTYDLRLADRSVTTRQVAEDPDAGVLRVPVFVPFELGGVPVMLDAGTYGRGRGELVQDPDGETARVTFALDSRVLLRTHVAPPADGLSTLVCERWAEEYGYWSALGRPVDGAAVVTATVDFGPLAPGRYRVRDVLTGIVSEAVELRAAAGAADVHLDLSRAGVARGRVVVPDGVDFERVGIRVDGAAPEDGPRFVELVGPDTLGRAPRGTRKVGPDGAFSLRVPGDREVVVRAWHPWLRDDGGVRITTPRDDLVLRLDRGPMTTLVLPEDVPERLRSQAAWSWSLFRASEDAEPAFRGVCDVVGNEARLGGYEPGMYWLFVDVATRAPLFRRVTLGPGDERIDVKAWPYGATVVVTVRATGARPRRGFRVRAEHLGTPGYVRSNIVVGAKEELRCPNLGPGRFRVLVRDLSEGAAAGEILLDEEVESDGETDVPLVLDLR